MDVGDSNAALEDSVELGLVKELGMLRPDWFQFDGYFFVRFDVGAYSPEGRG